MAVSCEDDESEGIETKYHNEFTDEHPKPNGILLYGVITVKFLRNTVLEGREKYFHTK